MDESLQELENELKALRPSRPSVLLRARVERELADPVATTPAASVAGPRYRSATTLSSWKWLSWQSAAAAAVVLTVSLGVWRGQPSSPAVRPESGGELAAVTPRAAVPVEQPVVADSYRPVKAANLLYDLQDEGLVLLEDNTPARRVRARYVDTFTWKNPATNASLKWSVPRDEVRMVPARFN